MKNLESHIKTSLENYEAPYNPADWADVENRLNNAKARNSSNAGKIVGIASGILVVAGLVYFFTANNFDNNQVEKISSQQIIADINKTQDNLVQKEEKNNAEPQVIDHQLLVNGEKSSANDTSEKENSPVNNNAAQKISSVENITAQNTNNENNSPEVQQPTTPSASSLNATFHFNQSPICSGTAVQFKSDNIVPCTYRWEFGDGKTSGEKSPSHIYKNAGTYSVKLKLTGTKEKVSDEKHLILVVNATPSVEIYFSASENNPSEINFEARGNNGSASYITSISEYSWNFDDKQTSAEKNPVHNYTKTGNYQITLTAKNSFGCTGSDKKMVSIENLFPLAPNSFSPNGDGLNDRWMPASLQNGDYNFTLTVYDKNGMVVFKTSDKNQLWNGGNAKTGDTFIWKTMVKEKNGEESNYKGVITIVE